MKKEPKYQGQHKVPQVYLKQFGYNNNGEHLLSVYKVGNKKSENIRIYDFTKETNIFDLTQFTEFEAIRSFENLNGEIENYYRTIVNNLKNQKRLPKKDKHYLIHFVANILCRTDPFRTYIEKLLYFPNTREKLIQEISIFTENSEDIKKALNTFKVEYQLNLALLYVMEHLVNVMKHFKTVIIKGAPKKGCLTTDSPVYLDKYENEGSIINQDTEIYMPISKDFCLFMFHENSNFKTNPLRKLRINKINLISDVHFEEMTKKYILNYNKYLIFNTPTEPTKIGLK